MRLSFVGHAGALIETDDVCLLMDPWLEGFAFNDAWALHPPPVLQDADLQKVTHLWVSHEHPDHFSPASLLAIPAEARSGITVLFQKRYDTEVLDFMASAGFLEVVELPHARFVQIGPRTEAYCRQIGHEDSCLLIRTEKLTVLNLNDCLAPASTLRKLKRDAGAIDLLMNQFSIAGWPGNPDQTERRRAAAHEVLDRFVRDFDFLKPRCVLPFASFMRWCHEENAYINGSINTIQDVISRIDPQHLVVMYPGDTWHDLRVPFGGTADAMARYAADRDTLDSLPLVTHDPVDLDVLVQTASDAVAQIASHYHRSLLRRIPPVRFRISDIDRVLEVSLISGVKLLSAGEAHVDLSSQAAWYTFKHRWGLPTLGISGRFRTHEPEEPFWRLKKLGSAYSSGLFTREDGHGLVRSLYNHRRASYLWARRRDLPTEFVARLRS